MKTLFKMIFVLVLMLGVAGLMMAQSKTGDRTKKSGSANAQAPQASADKKTSGDGDNQRLLRRRGWRRRFYDAGWRTFLEGNL